MRELFPFCNITVCSMHLSASHRILSFLLFYSVSWQRVFQPTDEACRSFTDSLLFLHLILLVSRPFRFWDLGTHPIHPLSSSGWSSAWAGRRIFPRLRSISRRGQSRLECWLEWARILLTKWVECSARCFSESRIPESFSSEVLGFSVHFFWSWALGSLE